MCSALFHVDARNRCGSWRAVRRLGYSSTRVTIRGEAASKGGVTVGRDSDLAYIRVALTTVPVGLLTTADVPL
jgi:hypothetical protein